jgi:recombination protein RecR
MSILDDFITTLSRLPGIGRKSAQKLAYYFLQSDADFAHQFAQMVIHFKESMHKCEICGCYNETTDCSFCHNSIRDHHTICIVAQAQDVTNIEKSQSYQGLYHVLGGLLAPLDGISPKDLSIDHLLHRIDQGGIQEVILATNLTSEGDATAAYLQQLLQERVPHITRIASGLPAGSDVEYADAQTLGYSLRGRKHF